MALRRGRVGWRAALSKSSRPYDGAEGARGGDLPGANFEGDDFATSRLRVPKLRLLRGMFA